MPSCRISTTIQSEKRNEFLQLMTDLSIDNENGKIESYENMQIKNTFLLLANFNNQQLLERYLHSNRFKILLGAIDALGFLLELKIEDEICLTNSKMMEE